MTTNVVVVLHTLEDILNRLEDLGYLTTAFQKAKQKDNYVKRKSRCSSRPPRGMNRPVLIYCYLIGDNRQFLSTARHAFPKLFCHFGQK